MASKRESRYGRSEASKIGGRRNTFGCALGQISMRGVRKYCTLLTGKIGSRWSSPEVWCKAAADYMRMTPQMLAIMSSKLAGALIRSCHSLESRVALRIACLLGRRHCTLVTNPLLANQIKGYIQKLGCRAAKFFKRRGNSGCPIVLYRNINAARACQ